MSLLLLFLSTLVIEDDIPKTMKWMSGRTQCTSSFRKFAVLLGYPFSGHPPLSHRIHMVEHLNKNLLKDLYGAGAVVGKNKGLFPLDDQLMVIFRSTIAPSGGNNDNLVIPLANHLLLAKRIIENDAPDRNFGFRVDVMDLSSMRSLRPWSKGSLSPMFLSS